MRKAILFIILLASILLSGCEYIPQYKFTSQIPDSLMEARYGIYYEHDRDNLKAELYLDANGSFTYEGRSPGQSGSDEYEFDYSVLLPERGVYSVAYSSYNVLSASGTIVFTGTGEYDGKRSVATFIWKADANEGIQSIQLSFSSYGVFTFVWVG